MYSRDILSVARAPVILPTVGNDPLDDFMALRMNLFSASNRQPPGTVKILKIWTPQKLSWNGNSIVLLQSNWSKTCRQNGKLCRP